MEVVREEGGAAWRHGFAEVEAGVRLHYVEQGEGPLVLLLHGFPECWYSWRHQIPALAAAGYRVLAPDLRGYNESDKPPGVRAYALPRLVADVRALIERFGGGRAAVVGHDWGGAVAWQIAMDHPDAVERLAVINCPHPAAFARNMRRGLRYNVRQLGRSWYMLFFQVPWLPERLLTLAGREFAGHRILGRAMRGAFTDGDLEHFQRALGQPGAARATIAYYRAAARSPLGLQVLLGVPPRVPALPMPTLLIWGERDVALGRELTDGTADLVAGPFELRTIPDASHWVQQEHPALCNAWLLEFLARREGVAA